MVFTKKLKLVVPTMHVGNTQIALVDENRLLGLIIDRRLNFTPRAVKLSVALKAWRAYQTVSLHSALILAKLLPPDIRVTEATKLDEVRRGKELRDICADRELERPVNFCNCCIPRAFPNLSSRALRTWIH
ncbi:hypothetical protein EVAR_34588_1 [Eumeta japonica]|uniref:Uncharacterized protein n=1 Tax=Eumeta variegata TaxID=151549 RepID=A0A4C1VG09_EUMVA|nr:hypothetical protein EVAR_34588_1 [Eumeta japonica]